VSSRSALPALLLALLVSAIPQPCDGTSLQVPIGPRAIAMGGAFSSIADDASAIFWNPAGLTFVGHQEISATHANLFGSDINDNYASFVLPLSRHQTAAADWYRSGFDDSELDFGENRIDLSYAHKIRSWISAGATIKYLARDTNLDGVSVRSGKGAGFDFGLLATPWSHLRVGVVAQDAFDTKLAYSNGEGTVVAYPRTVRVGASYEVIRRGLLSADLDDRIHVGAEYRPLPMIALRAGVQDDRGGPDGLIPSFGLGIRASVFRFDYALEDHPTLGSTSHFGLGLGFNFNPAQIRIEDVKVRDVYASLYKTYRTEPIGTVRLVNLEEHPIEAKLSVYVPELMNTRSEQTILLRPKAPQDFPVMATLSEKVMRQNGDRPVQVQVSAEYQSYRLPRTEKTTAKCNAFGPGVIDWKSGLAQAAAFVTTRDPVVEALARDVAQSTAGTAPGLMVNRNLRSAAALVDALSVLGVTYVADPNTPYSSLPQTRATDTIYYPSQTLARRTGDCDDTSVLVAALLGNLGIRTRFIDVPGHLFLLVDTGVHERNRLSLAVDESRYVIEDDEVWIPLETTVVGRGFAEAWSAGADRWGNANLRERPKTVDVEESQARYIPADFPGTPAPAPSIDMQRLNARLADDLKTIESWRQEYLTGRYGETQKGLEATPDALSELAHAYYLGAKFESARQTLERTGAGARRSLRTENNLATVYAAQGDLEGAARHYESALALDSADGGVWLNLGILYYAAGDTLGAGLPLAMGVARCGGYAAACKLLGLPTEEAGRREGTEGMAEGQLLGLLQSASRTLRPGAPLPRVPSHNPARPNWAGRKPMDGRILGLLYWKP
jgi:transglutaminase-like putative cysteine protease